MQILIKKYNLQYTIPEKIMELSKKVKQNWTDSKNIDICTYVIFGYYDQVLFPERKMSTRLCLHPNLRFF